MYSCVQHSVVPGTFFCEGSVREEARFSDRFFVKAAFVKKPDGGDLDVHVPDRPNVPFYLPSDIFYPLTLFSSGAERPRAHSRLHVLLVVGLMLVALW